MKKFAIGISGQTPKTVEADYFYFDNGFVILAKYKTDAERKSGVMPPMIAAYPQHLPIDRVFMLVRQLFEIHLCDCGAKLFFVRCYPQHGFCAFIARALFHGILASRFPIMRMSVAPAKVSPAPTTRASQIAP